MRLARVPSVLVVTATSWAASSNSDARARSALLDISTRDSPSRRVIWTGWSAAAAKTSAEARLNSED